MSQLLENFLVIVPVLLFWEKEQGIIFTKTRPKLGNSKIRHSYENFYVNERFYGTYLQSS
jgi:hypothetical protein